ncbi:MAG: phosphoribosylformylglycinamidine synthase I, partial [Bacteroidales bacterium]|nr:phosphoribosylformylglycinamidine synthase I [Bacteroidales bacterium]
MMPHPERAADPDLGNQDGAYILKSIIEHLENNKK